MNIDRRLLYWGVFFVAAGAVLLVGQSGVIDDDRVAQALALWPVLVIALGVGLLLRRTRFGIAGGMLAAAVPGLLLGGVVVAAPRVTPDCGFADPASFATRQGAFYGAASVDLRLACGDLSVTTAPGNGWRLETGIVPDTEPTIEVSAGRLAVASTSRQRAFGLGGDADDWRLTLPVANRLDLAADLSAGHGRFDLAGARLGTMRLTVNAADAQVDLDGAALSDLSLRANAARVSLILPAGSDFTADLDVNAAGLKVCAPGELGLRVRGEAVLGSTTYNGLERIGDAWQSPGYSMATHHADVTVSVNVGSVDINPVGGCK